jgi:hypothetical protein
MTTSVPKKAPVSQRAQKVQSSPLCVDAWTAEKGQSVSSRNARICPGASKKDVLKLRVANSSFNVILLAGG